MKRIACVAMWVLGTSACSEPEMVDDGGDAETQAESESSDAAESNSEGDDASSEASSTSDGADTQSSGTETDDGGSPCDPGFVECATECCDPERKIDLPVEVLGAEGTTVERVVYLDADQAASVEYLWLQVNNLSYENKASVRVNDGPWTDLNHDTVTMHQPEWRRGGMVHGGFSTVRVRLDTTGWIGGDNVLSFRFNDSDAISMGYRVVRFALLDASSADILDAEQFVHDDPATWTPPVDTPEAVLEGEALWRSAELWSHNLPNGRTGQWYDAEIPAAQPIKAACADCHTQDGRDLEIFAYSNHSIIERAKFHQLTHEQGELIASYIRSLSSSIDTVERVGRPWNPPYQPGPQVASRPVHAWAAGAGLDAVLDEDRDMLAAMFPGELDAQSVADYFDSGAMEDHTTLPLAIQLPDWKHWLPIIHPMDAFSADGFYEDPSVEYNPTRGLVTVREFLEAEPIEDRSPDQILSALSQHWRHYRRFLSQGSANPRHWRTRDGEAYTRGLAAGQNIASLELAATSLGRLLAVKHFELMNEFELQGLAPTLFDPADQPLPRQWLGRDYQVFELPPHFTACFDDVDECQHFQGQPNETGQFESTSWYHLQLVLNGGQGQMLHNSPVDNNYHPEFILRSNVSSGITEPLRYYSSINAMYQTRTWTGATTPNDGKGFRIRIQGPWYFLAKEGDSVGHMFHGFDPGEFPALLDDVAPGLTKWVLDALFQQFVREIQRPENDLATWQRWEPGIDESNALDPVTKSTLRDVTQLGPSGDGPLWADHTFWSIQQAGELGVDCEVLDEVVAWGNAAWPLIDFDQQRAYYTAYAQLRPDADGITALLGNEGDAPQLAWTVNGTAVSAGATLPDSAFSPGDQIELTLTSNAACLPASKRTVSAQLIAP